MGGAKADGDARRAGDRLDDADQLRRPVGAAVFLEARREIGDAHGRAIGVDQIGHHDGGVAHIVRARLDEAVEHHVGEAFFLVAGEQAG